MFLQLNEQHLAEFNFFKVFKKGRFGTYSLYYYKKGLYLKYLTDGYYAVYDSDMHILGTINNLYKVELMIIIKENPVYLN